jgi:hypothetical protein
MKIKARFTTVAIHLLAWMLLLAVPVLSTRQVINSIAGDHNNISFLPIVVLSLTLIALFYLNYFILLPRFLLKKKYGLYVLALLVSIGVGYLSGYLIFELFGLDPEKQLTTIEPLLARISPIAKANAFLMFMAAFLTSIVLVFYDRLDRAQKEAMNAQISFLKSQMNPHFLFNTLNNIYATTLDKSPEAADMIEKLSDMMRYTLREAQSEYVDLISEINYINNFIDLQKIRFERRVDLSYQVIGDADNQRIAPMLLMPFIENAFKHGVNTEENSRIEILLTIQPKGLHLRVVNNKVSMQRDILDPSGLGIKNTVSRLQLIYPGKHTLNIQDTGTEFSVILELTLL